MSRHLVLRPFPAGRALERGQVVDTTGWRNLQYFERTKFLERVPDETPPTVFAGPAPEGAASASAPPSPPPAEAIVGAVAPGATVTEAAARGTTEGGKTRKRTRRQAK